MNGTSRLMLKLIADCQSGHIHCHCSNKPVSLAQHVPNSFCNVKFIEISLGRNSVPDSADELTTLPQMTW